MMQLMRELERINGNLGKKVEDSTNLERKVVQLNQEIENLRRQLKEMRLPSTKNMKWKSIGRFRLTRSISLH